MCDPYVNLWITAEEWLENKRSWMTCKFSELDGDGIESKMDLHQATILKVCLLGFVIITNTLY